MNNLDTNLERPDLGIVGKVYLGEHDLNGVIFNSGTDYKEVRRFSLRTLRDLGFGKRSCEGMILDECEAVVKSIKKRINDSKES